MERAAIHACPGQYVAQRTRATQIHASRSHPAVPIHASGPELRRSQRRGSSAARTPGSPGHRNLRAWRASRSRRLRGAGTRARRNRTASGSRLGHCEPLVELRRPLGHAATSRTSTRHPSSNDERSNVCSWRVCRFETSSSSSSPASSTPTTRTSPADARPPTADDRVLALTIPERETIIRVLDDAPPGLEELRAVLIREHVGRVRDGLVESR